VHQLGNNNVNNFLMSCDWWMSFIDCARIQVVGHDVTGLFCTAKTFFFNITKHWKLRLVIKFRTRLCSYNMLAPTHVDPHMFKSTAEASHACCNIRFTVSLMTIKTKDKRDMVPGFGGFIYNLQYLTSSWIFHKT